MQRQPTHRNAVSVPVRFTRPGTVVLIAAAVGGLVATLVAGTVPAGLPEDVGLSGERLQRIGQVVQRAIDAERISGAVTLVARRGQIAHFEAQSLMDIEAGIPMRPDTIFPIASMSKPITSVAILMLIEEGKVRLRDPVSLFIPEFADPQVAIPMERGGDARGQEDSPEVYTVPAAREITIRDLMTHTSGLASGGAGWPDSQRIAPRLSAASLSLATHIPKLGGVPLDFQPGTQWAYSSLAGLDTLGRVVEVVSGQTFDEFLRHRIFLPLGMLDTTFVPPADKAARVIALYRRSPDGLQRYDVPDWLDSTTLFSGGAGLWSTAEDYLQFAQMLLNRGELDGTRLLGARTVDLMASNHVGELFAAADGRLGMGFGLTVSVTVDAVKAGGHDSTGSFGWEGAFGTVFRVEPKEDMVSVLMVQIPGGTLQAEFQNAVRQAIID